MSKFIFEAHPGEYESVLRVIYAIIHRQEVFLPFKNHPSFTALLENIYSVLDFFNCRIDARKMDGEWSVEKVLRVIVNNCRSWRGEGMEGMYDEQDMEKFEAKELAFEVKNPVYGVTSN